MVESGAEVMKELLQFQYSLCRVVLMVLTGDAENKLETGFQYSLCRVVLMVRYT